MKIKNLLMCFAACAVALTSCNKEDGPGSGSAEESFDLYAKFDLGVGTKADVDKLVDDGVTVTQFSHGGLFFTDAAGDIVRMVIIDDSPAGAVSASQIQAGFLFTDIDGSAEKVYVVGNYDFTSSSYTNISGVQSETVDILSQTGADFGVNNATLYGAGTLVPTTPSSEGGLAGADREAIFQIAPLIARMEIDEISAIGSDIDEFELAGIYINNFYTDMSVIGTTVLADLIHHGTAPADYQKYKREPSPGQYKTNWYEYLFDDGWDGTNVNLLGTADVTASETITPDNETWAYNVFANGSALPHIVLHFTGVKLNNGGSPALRPNATTGNDGEAYLTITGYHIGGADQPILGGNVYELASVLFDEDDLDDYPYEKDDKSPVYVKVSVKPWKVISVDWK